MKVAVKNLGAIKDGKVELGKLTVICGANNTGKSYLAYAIYGFHRFAHGFSLEKLPPTKTHPVLTVNLIEELVRTGEAISHVDMDAYMKYYSSVYKRVLAAYHRELHEWLAGDPADFEATKLMFTPDLALVEKTIKHRLARLSKADLYRTTIDCQNGKIEFTSKKPRSPESLQLSPKQLLRRLINEFDSFIFKPVIKRPFIVTADRMGVTIFSKDLDANRNTLIHYLQNPVNGKDDNPTQNILASRTSKFPLPISHEVDFVRELTLISKQRGELYEILNKKFHERIEEMMNARYVRTEFETLLVSKTNKNNGFSIPLHRASTAARELSSLYFYLKHVAGTDDFLIIDEPESHLSSKNQILLVRLLCDCVSAGMQVMVSTHSEIIMNEISNNIMLKQMIKANARLDKFHKHYSGHSGVDFRDVRACYSDQGTVKQCLVTNLGMYIPQINSTLHDQADDAMYLSNWVIDNEDI